MNDHGGAGKGRRGGLNLTQFPGDSAERTLVRSPEEEEKGVKTGSLLCVTDRVENSPSSPE